MMKSNEVRNLKVLESWNSRNRDTSYTYSTVSDHEMVGFTSVEFGVVWLGSICVAFWVWVVTLGWVFGRVVCVGSGLLCRMRHWACSNFGFFSRIYSNQLENEEQKNLKMLSLFPLPPLFLGNFWIYSTQPMVPHRTNHQTIPAG